MCLIVAEKGANEETISQMEVKVEPLRTAILKSRPPYCGTLTLLPEELVGVVACMKSNTNPNFLLAGENIITPLELTSIGRI